VQAATLKALILLQRAPEGYLLVVEWDAHTDDPREGLQNVVEFDKLIGEVERRVDLNDTLLLFTADHSFGLQVDGGARGGMLLDGFDNWKATRQQPGEEEEEAVLRLKNVMVNATHTAERSLRWRLEPERSGSAAISPTCTCSSS
jgi:alkaline phosphatase